MDRTLIRKIMRLERELARIKVLERFVPETVGGVSALALTGLRGLWQMSAVDTSGNALDISGHGRTLTYNGNPVYGSASVEPYIALDGTGDYLSRADEAELDITGTETYIETALRGLTYFTWVRFDNAVGSTEGIMSKWDAGSNNRSYQIYRDATGDCNFEISDNGTNIENVALATSLVTVDTWFFVAARFDPAQHTKVWVNTDYELNETTVPASCYASTADLYLGAQNGSNLLTGKIGISGLCAAALSDRAVAMVFEMTRGIYGV